MTVNQYGPASRHYPDLVLPHTDRDDYFPPEVQDAAAKLDDLRTRASQAYQRLGAATRNLEAAREAQTNQLATAYVNGEPTEQLLAQDLADLQAEIEQANREAEALQKAIRLAGIRLHHTLMECNRVELTATAREHAATAYAKVREALLAARAQRNEFQRWASVVQWIEGYPLMPNHDTSNAVFGDTTPWTLAIKSVYESDLDRIARYTFPEGKAPTDPETLVQSMTPGMTIRVRGSGGAVFDMDVPKEENRRDIFNRQVIAGELTILTTEPASPVAETNESRGRRLTPREMRPTGKATEPAPKTR